MNHSIWLYLCPRPYANYYTFLPGPSDLVTSRLGRSLVQAVGRKKHTLELAKIDETSTTVSTHSGSGSGAKSSSSRQSRVVICSCQVCGKTSKDSQTVILILRNWLDSFRLRRDNADSYSNGFKRKIQDLKPDIIGLTAEQTKDFDFIDSSTVRGRNIVIVQAANTLGWLIHQLIIDYSH